MLHPAGILLRVLSLRGFLQDFPRPWKAALRRGAGCCQCKGQEPETECCGPVRQAATCETNHRLASCWNLLSFMLQTQFSAWLFQFIFKQSIFPKLRFMSIVVPMGGADRYLMHRYETKASLICVWHEHLEFVTVEPKTKSC